MHQFWRAHNREYLLKQPEAKSLYLKSIVKALDHKSVKQEVELTAYCVMSNHVHTIVRYKNGSMRLSNFMRVGHTRFGQAYNKINKRQGPVAYDRPKTPLIQEQLWNIMRVHFYVEANPLRARMTNNLKLYGYSSYRFYAWGIVDEFSKKLTVPEWYMELGATSKARQAKYRSLFDKYQKEVMIQSKSYTGSRYVGDPLWVVSMELHYAQQLRVHKTEKISTDPPGLIV